MTKHFVFDTNSLISASLLADSVNRKAILKVIQLGKIALSNETFDEFIEVLFRKKFDKYFFDENERLELFSEIEQSLEYFSPTEKNHRLP